MCDYSLYAFPNRLARDGEELVANRFSSGCIGFVSVSDASEQGRRRTWLGTDWRHLKPLFLPRRHDGPAAVCVPPGTELKVVSLDPRLRQRLGLHETEDATFVQVSAHAFAYRDGLLFRNGRRILLQELPEGQHVFVVSSATPEIHSDRQREETYA